MVPPFLASYAVATHDVGYLEEAVRQCRLYGDVLGTNVILENGTTCRGLWMHIASQPSKLPQDVCCTDSNVWLTSNAWAVAGITRVLATILKWSPPQPIQKNFDYHKFSQHNTQILVSILIKMLNCVMGQARDNDSGLLKNYLDGSSSDSAQYAYGDTAGTALMASAVYRLAVLLPDTFGTFEFLDWANTNRRAVSSHVDGQGKVSPVADVSHVPSREPAEQTSEGQSMVLLMYSAWRDCRRIGICGD
jgi:rhamnogalacturonyl hydrolase YesR